MRGIDTNILVRFLVQDDPEQSRTATDLLTRFCTDENPGFVDQVVLCELVWVLEGFYGYTREQVSLALSGIIRATNLSIEEREEVREALNQYNAGADFPDVLIGLVNLRRGCEHTLTFDRKAGRLRGFRRL